MAQWTKREFGKGEIDRAGDKLVPWWTAPAAEATPEIGLAYRVVDNWRACHAYPLNVFQVNLRNRARRVDKDALVAQRLKRFMSVMNKLVREPNMKLSQMHDVGGCRAIVSTVQSVEDLLSLHRGTGGLLFESEGSMKCYDYLKNPKPDGYRGIHVVGRYNARIDTKAPWNGQRIEIQIRTRLQHAFATAVETVTTFTRSPLKFGGGPDDWRRFFSLMGSAIAAREGTAFVPGTPTDRVELIRELGESVRELKVKQRLQSYADALKALPSRNLKDFKWLMLVLDVNANTIRVVGYSDRAEARKVLSELEQNPAIGSNLDVVLVGVKNARDLRAAYPNYYADTREFVNALDLALREGA
jgi:hypothetical protein